MSQYWTNESVLRFAGGRDPLEAIEHDARELVLRAVEQGWAGPPFDPFELARILDIPVEARQELRDARIVPTAGNRLRIEYNPTRPPARLRFSLAHEIAHSLFDDVARAARYRADPEKGPSDAWQLELLCNVAAGEILMPTDLLTELREGPLELEHLMRLQREFAVSTEALLRRAVKLTNHPVAMFASSRIRPLDASSPFRLDYLVGARAWRPAIRQGQRVAPTSVLGDCTAIGYTARKKETWAPTAGELTVQAVGVPPFPGHRFPRVLGLLHPHGVRPVSPTELTLVHGDATKPRGKSIRIIVHLVNDRATTWNGAFASALRRAYPRAHEGFQEWITEDRTRLALGQVLIDEVDDDVYVATIIGQHGYGPSATARVRYAAIQRGLEPVADFALAHQATVHGPRLGAGQAGGRWPVIRELLETALTRRGVPVTIYVPPNEQIDDPEPTHRQLGLEV